MDTQYDQGLRRELEGMAEQCIVIMARRKPNPVELLDAFAKSPSADIVWLQTGC